MTTTEEMTKQATPHSKESEMMVLGCMLNSANALNVGADRLKNSDFYFPEHQKIFKALQAAYHTEKPADIHLISEELKKNGHLDSVGGIPYLTNLAQYAGTSVFIDEYANLVQEKSILRQMIDASKQIQMEVAKGPNDVHCALDEAQGLFFAISQSANRTAGIPISEYLSGLQGTDKIPYLKELQERQEEFHEKGKDQASITGISTGFLDLDRILNGLNPANLIILAARPSMGKTALALNIASNIAFDQGLPVGIFSLEMTAQELIHRMICSRSEVASEKILTGSLDGIEYQQIVETVHHMQKHSLIIDDQPGLKITDLRARARRLKEIFDIKILFVDYLQLLSGSRSYYNTDNRQNEISEISRMLKNLARELGIPIMCLSQLSRKVEERSGHRPMLSDLRESGSIEQDADAVLLIFRPEYYNPSHKPGLAELLVGKNRHGQVGDVALTFRKKFATFESYTPMEEENYPEPEE